MTLEQRIELIEKKLNLIEQRHDLEDLESKRVEAAVSHAAIKGIDDLLAEQPK